MNFSTIKTWLAGLCVLALVGCGGGAGSEAGTSGFGGGSGSGSSATVTLVVSSSTVTAATPATVTLTVRDAAGNPIAGTVVDLTTERGSLATLSVASVATDAMGTATATLSAASGGISGSDRVLGIAKLGTTTIQGAVSFTVAGSAPTIAVTIDSTTLRASTGATILRAFAKDAAGKPVPNLLVTFTSAGKRVTLGASSAKTDAAGAASVTAAVVDPTVTAADSLTASATVFGVDVKSEVVVQVVADTPSLTISANRFNVSATTPATLSIQVMDANGKAVGAGTVVSLVSTFGLSAFDVNTASTNSSGVAQVLVSPKSATSNGADQIVASATVGGVTITAQTVLQVSTLATASVSISVFPSTISSGSPATVTVAVRDTKGNPVPGTVVDLSTARGTLATLSVSSVATDALGNATATLTAASGARGGADQIIAVAKLGTTTVQGSASFTVAGSVATLGLTISSTTLRGSTGAATLSASVRDAAGNPVPNLLVTFAAASGRVSLGAPSAMTDGFGNASVTAVVADASVTAADTLTASTTVGATALQTSVVVQLVADTPTLTFTASSPNVSATAPATLSILVKDYTGKAVGAGTIISISSAFGLSAFDANTVATNASGMALVVVSPKSPSSNGADQIVVSATVGGVAVTAQTVVQVISPAATSVTLAVSGVITPATPQTVTVTVRDARGIPVPGIVVDLSTVRGTLAVLNAASVATDSNGTATATLTAASGGQSGADQVLGIAKIGTATVQGSASFSVAGSVATVGLTISPTTLRGATSSATLKAFVKDAAGNPAPNVLVAFASVGGWVKFNAPSAISNGAGEASIVATVVDASVTAGDTLTASATVGGTAVQSAVVVQLVGDTPSMTISASNSNITLATPATLDIKVLDSAGVAVGAGTVVSVSSSFGLSAFDASTLVTNASGIAQAVVSPKTATSNGADRVTATATYGGVTVSAQTVVQVMSSTTTTVTLAVSSPVVTSTSPVTVTVTVRDGKGLPVAGTVVDLSTARGNLATLNVASVATAANGTATATLFAGGAGLSGADQVVGIAKIGANTVQGLASFTVSQSAPTINVAISSTMLRGSTGNATLSATVKDAGGNLVPNLLVSFASVGNKVKLGAPSAMTNGFGVATATAAVADPSVTSADTLTASATVAGVAVQSTLVVQLVADAPSMLISASSSKVTAAAPATLSIRVLNANGASVGAGTIVNISSAFGLSAFDAITASTDSSGVAQVVVTPKAGNSNGADQIIANATVGGVAITAQVVVQVSTSTFTSPPVLSTRLLDASGLPTTSVSSATPATVEVTLKDGRGLVVAGEVVTFTVVRGLAKTNINTALTDSTGKAVVVLSPTISSIAGADEVSAMATYAGVSLQSTRGFQIQATNVTLTSFTSAVTSLGAYGQTTLTVGLTGAAVGSPVNVSVTSSCVSQGKATLSPSTFTATSATVLLQFKDNGCGALQTDDKLQASIVGGSGTASLSLPIASPTASSLAFISASPEVIYIKASGFTETSTLTFEVRDGAGNILPNRAVVLSLLTRTGGVTIEGGTADVVQTSDAGGRVTVRVNSGTVPTPIRVSAKLQSTPTIATVSSNLSVAVGLPSQLNFSMSQKTKNIEGFDIDGTINAYNIIASDRSGNPVPAGTSVNFVTEGGQVEPIKQIQLASGLARTSAGFISSNPRPADGRITVLAYALGEESFIDQNGNNSYDLGEPFQDLGNIFKDRNFDGIFDVSVDEYIPTNIANGSSCLSPALSGPVFNGSIGVTAATSALLAFDPSIPSVGSSTCDGVWSGAGKVYVRRAAETVLSTSAARVLWGNKSGLDASCTTLTLQTGPLPTTNAAFTPVQGGETWYGNGSASLTLPFIVADANTFPVPGLAGAVGRLNPMAAETKITVSTPTTGLKVVLGGGSPVPSTTEATLGSVGVTFDTVSAGVVFVTFTSPSTVSTTYAINVQQTRTVGTTTCP